MAETVPCLTPPFQPHAAPHFLWMDLFLLYLGVWFQKKKRTTRFIHLLKRQTGFPSVGRVKVLHFLTRGRLNSGAEMASSSHTSTTSKDSFRCLQDCFALWGKQKYNLVAHSVQSDILLWDKAAWGHKVLFVSTELDLFIILHEIASLWKF